MVLDAIAIRQLVSKVFVDKFYAVHHEVGIDKQGRYRADLIATNTKPYIVIVEIKSSVADFKADKKFHNYLPRCNQFYFGMTDLVYNKVKHLIPKGIGTFVVNSETLSVTLKGRSAKRTVDTDKIIDVLSRCSYRTASVKKHERKNETNGAKRIADEVTDSLITQGLAKYKNKTAKAIYSSIKPYI